MVSNVACLQASELESLMTFSSKRSIKSGHCMAGISAHAIYATHWAAELWTVVSVPKAARHYRSASDGELTFCLIYKRASGGNWSQRCWYTVLISGSLEYKAFFSWRPACIRTTDEHDKLIKTSLSWRRRRTRSTFAASSRYCWAASSSAFSKTRNNGKKAFEKQKQERSRAYLEIYSSPKQ